MRKINIFRFYSLKFLIVIFITCSTVNSYAQWNQFCYFDTAVGMGHNAIFADADFVNADTGLYGMSEFISVSSGTSVSTKRTIDGGNSWMNSYGILTPGGAINEIKTVRKQNTFYLITQIMGIGTLLKSDNTSNSFRNIGGIGSMYYDFFALDTNRYFVLNVSSGNGNMIKYVNGITDFNYATFQSFTPVEVVFTDSLNGYVVAFDAVSNKKHLIHKSVNGGLNWSQVFDDTTLNINNIFFISPDLGYAVCDSGKAIKTIDGGSNWQYLTTGVYSNLNSVFFLNDTLGFAAGDLGVIIRTTNGGITWTRDTVSTNKSFRKIFFVNDSIGMALIRSYMYKINLNSVTSVWSVMDNGNQQLTVMPNPGSGKIYVEIPEMIRNQKEFLIIVYNNIGEIIYRKEINAGLKTLDLDLESHPRGFYYLTISQEQNRFCAKVVLD